MGKRNETERLGSESIGRLLLQMSLPAVVAQIINLLYNIVDRIYIGHIPEVGPLALTGVGLFAPIIAISQAFASLVCTGGAPMMAMSLGKEDKEKAAKYLGNCFVAVIAIGLVFMVVLFAFAPQLLLFFGASENTLPYGLTYMRICALGSVFNMFGVGLNLFISSQGFAMTAMLSTVIGAIINIVLDPIFIFVFDMGVAGAAIATVLSQAVSAIWITLFLVGRKCTVRITHDGMKIDRKVLTRSLALGASSFIMFLTEGLLSMTFTRTLFAYGADLAVGAMTIITSVNMFLSNIQHGVVVGGQPIISFNYGAGKMRRCKKAFNLILLVNFIYGIVFWLTTMIVPTAIASIFTPDIELARYTAWAMRIFFACCFVSAFQCSTQNSFVAMGQAKISMALALLRKVILLIPAIMILPHFFPGREVMSVFLAEPICDVIAATITTITFLSWFNREIRRREGESNEE